METKCKIIGLKNGRKNCRDKCKKKKDKKKERADKSRGAGAPAAYVLKAWLCQCLRMDKTRPHSTEKKKENLSLLREV